MIRAIDLCINFPVNENLAAWIKKIFQIYTMGIYKESLIFKDKNSIIMRKRYTNYDVTIRPNAFFYLFYQEFLGNAEDNYNNTDILVMNCLSNSKLLLKKLSGKNIGFEFSLYDLKYLDNYQLGRWFSEIKYFYILCERYGHQLILSSGARNIFELVSFRLFNSILEKLNISPNDYWLNLNEWLASKRRGVIYDTD